MENLIQLVNKIQRACTALGDHGEESAMPTLWDALPSIAVVGGQVSLSSCKSFYDLESIIIVILLNVINVRNFSLRDRSLSVMF
jgi:hypothetical protein